MTDSNSDNGADLTTDPDFIQFEKTQSRLSFGYAAVALGVFTTFVTAMICWPETLAQKLFNGSEISLALVGALSLIVLPLLIAGLYLRAIARILDPIRKRLSERRDQ